MNYSEAQAILDDASRTVNVVSGYTTRFAQFIVYRLRQIDNVELLKDLKRELRDFNIHTGEWK